MYVRKKKNNKKEKRIQNYVSKLFARRHFRIFYWLVIFFCKIQSSFSPFLLVLLFFLKRDIAK